MDLDAKELIERTVYKLCGKGATVRTSEDEHGAVFEIFSVNNAALIGKQRATIDALRTLAKALGLNKKHRIKVVLRERTQETWYPDWNSSRSHDGAWW